MVVQNSIPASPRRRLLPEWGMAPPFESGLAVMTFLMLSLFARSGHGAAVPRRGSSFILKTISSN